MIGRDDQRRPTGQHREQPVDRVVDPGQLGLVVLTQPVLVRHLVEPVVVRVHERLGRRSRRSTSVTMVDSVR